ncbi:MAG: hypothetical protein ABMA64_20435 [Myxococcota bacterium]
MMHARATWWAIAAGAGLAGCSPDPDPVPEARIERLTPVEHLVRASMAVRGTRPSLAEIDTVRADAGALPGLIRGWLDSEAFGDTIEDLHAELYLLRADTNYQLPVQGILVEAGFDQGDLHRSTVGAPTRLVREIVLEDRPYTEILTTDYTVADGVVSAIYGLDYDPGGDTWQHTHWTDGRPQSGLLSDSELWRRHVSNAANYHRGRANFVSRTFLCEDVGRRDVFVEGGVNIANPDEVAEAVSTQPSCVGCHNVVDPMAAFFWGYKEQIQRNAVLQAYQAGCEWDWSKGPPPLDAYRVEHWCYPLKFYDVAEEGLWEEKGLKAPAFYGVLGETMEDLGRMVTEDPRFATCAARSFAGYLTQTDRYDVPEAWAGELAQVFVDSGYSAKALVEAIVVSEPFAAARVVDDPGESVFVAGLQTIRPEQVGRTLADLTGFSWVANEDYPGCEVGGNNCWGTVDLTNSDVYGFRSMMGGIDSWTVTHPTHTPTPTQVMAVGLVADEAAGFVVEHDFAVAAGERRLLGGVEADTTDEAAVRAQIAALALRMFGREWAVGGEDASGAYALWKVASDRAGDPAEGWRVVISALLQDPELVFY